MFDDSILKEHTVKVPVKQNPDIAPEVRFGDFECRIDGGNAVCADEIIEFRFAVEFINFGDDLLQNDPAFCRRKIQIIKVEVFATDAGAQVEQVGWYA